MVKKSRVLKLRRASVAVDERDLTFGRLHNWSLG